MQTGAGIVNYMDCGKCHDEGAKGIDFSIASARLRQDWIPRWLKDTRELIPWTKMPAHWDKKGNEYLVKTKFDKLKTVGNVDQQIDAVKDFIIAYNLADVDFYWVLGDEASGGGSSNGAVESGAEDDAGSEGEEEDLSEDQEEEPIE